MPLDRAVSFIAVLTLSVCLPSPAAAAAVISVNLVEQETAISAADSAQEHAAPAATSSDPEQRAPIEVSVDVGPQPLLYRPDPSGANRWVMTADARFRRSERVHLEVRARPGVKGESARLLDQAGQPLDVRVDVSERTDPRTRQRLIVADVALASLAPADYVIELQLTESPDSPRIVNTGIRVVR